VRASKSRRWRPVTGPGTVATLQNGPEGSVGDVGVCRLGCNTVSACSREHRVIGVVSCCGQITFEKCTESIKSDEQSGFFNRKWNSNLTTNSILQQAEAKAWLKACCKNCSANF
jgi:hypothetical protein